MASSFGLRPPGTGNERRSAFGPDSGREGDRPGQQQKGGGSGRLLECPVDGAAADSQRPGELGHGNVPGLIPRPGQPGLLRGELGRPAAEAAAGPRPFPRSPRATTAGLLAALAARYRRGDVSVAAAAGGFGALITRAGANGSARQTTASALLTFGVAALTLSCRRFPLTFRVVPTDIVVSLNTHGEPNGDRRLVIAGGWLEVAVEMASVINVGTVLLRRPRAGMGVVGVLSPPLPAGADATRARQPRVQVARSALLRVPRGVILWPVMAGGAWRGITLSMLVYFAAAKRKVAWHLSRVALRPGTGRLVNARICPARIRGCVSWGGYWVWLPPADSGL